MFLLEKNCKNGQKVCTHPLETHPRLAKRKSRRKEEGAISKKAIITGFEERGPQKQKGEQQNNQHFVERRNPTKTRILKKIQVSHINSWEVDPLLI